MLGMVRDIAYTYYYYTRRYVKYNNYCKSVTAKVSIRADNEARHEYCIIYYTNFYIGIVHHIYRVPP